MNTSKRHFEIAVVVGFLAIHLAAPLMFGELYPFTISPMFSDQPAEYAVYEVLDSNGNSLDLEPFGLHLVYDGNPVGLGMGIKATETLHGFGEVPPLEELKTHVTDKLAEMPELAEVSVRRKRVFCNDHKLVEAIDEFQVFNPLAQRQE